MTTDRLGLEPVPPRAEATSLTVQALDGSVGLSYLPGPLHMSDGARLGSRVTSVLLGLKAWEPGARFCFWMTPFLRGAGGSEARAQPQVPRHTCSLSPEHSRPSNPHGLISATQTQEARASSFFLYLKKKCGGLETTKSISEAQTFAEWKLVVWPGEERGGV